MDDLPQSAPVVDCAAYVDGRRASHLTIEQLSAVLAQPDRFVWLGLYEPEQVLLRRLQAALGLHDLAIEDAINAHQRPKIELYEKSLFVVLRTVHRPAGSHRLVFGETHLFVGSNYVVTVRHGSLRSHIAVRQRCESTPHLLAKGPGYVLYAVMDFVVDQFLPILQQIEEEVEYLEETILQGSATADTTARIYHLKRDLVALRRAVSPLVDVCNRLMRFDLPNIPEETKPYFRDVYDHVLRVNESIDAQRELLSAALDAQMSVTSVAQNEHMRRITAWAAMIAAPTMIAGIYGMNFVNIPELQWRYGYFLALLLMGLASFGLFVGFKRSGWL